MNEWRTLKQKISLLNMETPIVAVHAGILWKTLLNFNGIY